MCDLADMILSRYGLSTSTYLAGYLCEQNANANTQTLYMFPRSIGGHRRRPTFVIENIFYLDLYHARPAIPRRPLPLKTETLPASKPHWERQTTPESMDQKQQQPTFTRFKLGTLWCPNLASVNMHRGICNITPLLPAPQTILRLLAIHLLPTA
jgi:hypothetical protein